MFRRSISVFPISLFGAIFSAGAVTPVVYDTSSSTYTQNFDTLPNSGPSPYLNVAAGPAIDVPTSTDGVGLAGWSFAKTSGTGTNSIFRYDDGTGFSGAVYSFGATGETERALGSIASNSTVSSFGLTLSNNTGGFLTSFTLSYTGEIWRLGAAAGADALNFSYAVGSPSVVSGTFVPVPQLDFNVAAAPASTGVPVNGNAPANQTLITFTVNNLLWEAGTSMTLKWSDANISGNDDGMAIDNLSFSALAGSVPTVDWNVTDGTWDTTTPNWTGSATVFHSGDVARFGEGHAGIVTIDAAGVSPEEVQVSNQTGIYTFQGGALQGSGSLVKTGAGTMILSSDFQLAGGLRISGGTVQTSANELLGDTRPVTVSAGGTLDVGSHFETLGPLVLAGGRVTSASDGLLTFNADVQVQESAVTSVISGELNTGAIARLLTVADGGNAVDLQVDARIVGGTRITFAGVGTKALNGDNSGFLGGVTLSAGELQINNKDALGGGQFFFNGGKLTSTADLIGANAVATIVSAGGSVTIDATHPLELRDLRNSFGGATAVMTVIGDLRISGSLGFNNVINKAGSGTVTLSEASPYSGDTTVRAGTLKLTGNGAITGSANLRVDSGATFDLSTLGAEYSVLRTDALTQTLRGGGTVLAPTAGLRIDGALAPGTLAVDAFFQTLTVQGGPLTLGSMAVLQMELGGVDPASYDALVLLGQMLALDGTLQISLVGGFVPNASDTFTIITSDGGFTGQFANLIGGRVSFAQGSFLVTQSGDKITLGNFAAVPEPESCALLVIGILAIAGVSSCRRKLHKA